MDGFRVMVGAVLIAGSACADVIYVDHAATGAGDGSGWADAYTHPVDAFAAAAEGDEIWIAEGVYTPIAMDQPFEVPPGVALYGGFGGGETDLDQRDPDAHVTHLSGDLNGDDGAGFTNRADNAVHVVRFENPGAANRLDGLVISGGDAPDFPDDSGAGVWINLGTLVVADCVFEDNRASDDGGAVWANSASLVLENCRFENNVAERFGGAIRISQGSIEVNGTSFVGNHADLDGGAAWINFVDSVAALGCEFEGNTSGGTHGGAVRLYGNRATFDDCRFAGNKVSGGSAAFGGAITISGTDVDPVVASLTRCDFTDNRVTANTASHGGALHVSYGGGVTIADCSFTGNVSEAGTVSFGGAVYLGRGDYGMVRCLIENNEASLDAHSGGGGGLYVNSSEESPAQCRIVASRICGNRGHDGGAIGSFGDNAMIRIAGSVISGNAAENVAAVYAQGDVQITGSTVSGNALLVPGTSAALTATAGTLTVTNSILWANGDDADESSELNPLHAVSVSHSCVEGWTGSLGGAGNTGADPLFRDPNGADDTLGTADDDYTFRRYSPCIDAGDNTGIPQDLLDVDDDGDTGERLPTDIDGNPRRADDVDVADSGSGTAPVVDIGAVEFQLRSCPADLDFNGILDLTDITMFIETFTGTQAPGDLNADGVWDLADVVLFIGLFKSGCP